MIAPEKAEEGDAVVRVIRKNGTIGELLGNGRAVIDWDDGTRTKVRLADLEYARPQPWEKMFGSPLVPARAMA